MEQKQQNGFWRVVSYLKNYKGIAAANIVFNLLAVIFSLVSLTMVMPFLSLLFDKTDLVMQPPPISFSADYVIGWFNYYLSKMIVEAGKTRALLFVCIVVLVVFLFKNAFRYAALYLMAIIRNGVVRDIRQEVFQKMTSLPISYFGKQQKGDILTRLTSDVQEIEYGIMSVLELTFREVLTVVAYLLAMVFISPKLTLFVLIVLPISGFIVGRIGRTLKKKSHVAQERMANLLQIISETIEGLRIVKSFNAVERQNEHFRQNNQAHYNIMKSMLRRRDLSSPLSEFMGIVIVVIVLYVGGSAVLQNSLGLEAETFIGFMLIFSQIISPAKSFSNAFYQIQKGIASVERVGKILDAPQTISSPPNAIRVKTFDHQLSFKNVDFAYQANQPVLKNINFNLARGQVLALVGHSGAGKSTIADLVPRFYDVTKGQILLDGKDIRHLNLHDLRNLIGIVTQEPILFNDTIFNNIAYGKTNATLSQVQQAAKAANAHQFISNLPQGYQTPIGDRGQLLSGGERQRLTIARAILKNPPILILDEATSSLDSKSEKLVQDALSQLMQNRTSIIIAHRLSTIQFAHQILVLNDGEIIERGTHKELLQQKDGKYRQLVQLQGVSQ